MGEVVDVKCAVCANVGADLAAVVLDRVAELPRRWTRVRVEVGRLDLDGFNDDDFIRHTDAWFAMEDRMPVHAICHAHPTDSQHLAECLLNDPDIDSLLRDVRAKHGIGSMPQWTLGEPFDPAALFR